MIGVPFVDQVNAIAEVTTRAGRVDRVSVDIPATLSSFNEYPGHLVIEAHGSDGATSLLIEQSDDAKILTAYLYDPDGNHEKVFPSEADRN